VKKTRKAPQRNIIGKRVRQARFSIKPEVTQEDLAGRMAARGVFMDRTAISRIELQERYVMDFEAKALAQCLKVTVAWLYGETPAH
jgi:transcriptional regulator with XRE-family HTH domain